MTASLNPYISQFGEEFDAEKSSQYRMAIQCELGGLSFALLDTKIQTFIGVEYYQSELLTNSNNLIHTLERALESKGLNNKDFQSVIFLIDNRFCSLIPEPLFNEADQAKYLEFSFQIPENYTIVSEPLSSIQSRLVFATPTVLLDTMYIKWKNTKITHSSSVFINLIMKNDLESGVFLQVRNRDFDMIIKKDGKLFFFNNFKFITKEDFAYFLLFAMEQNHCSGQTMPVYFSGLILPASEIIDLCGRYVKDIRFVENPHSLRVSKAMESIPYHYYFTHYQALK